MRGVRSWNFSGIRDPKAIETDRDPCRKAALRRTFPYRANHICCIFAGKGTRVFFHPQKG
jgi:hypothetical protein